MHIRSDSNGSEFIAQAIWSWLSGATIDALYIRTGQSVGERLCREASIQSRGSELLAVEVFYTLAQEAKTLGMTWRPLNTNHRRPHSSFLGLQDTGVVRRVAKSPAPVATLPTPGPAKKRVIPIAAHGTQEWGQARTS